MSGRKQQVMVQPIVSLLYFILLISMCLCFAYPFNTAICRMSYLKIYNK